MNDTNPIGDVVVADEHDVHPRGRTWILRWYGGDSTAMTEDEAGQLARGLRALKEMANARAAALEEAGLLVDEYMARWRGGDAPDFRRLAEAIRTSVPMGLTVVKWEDLEFLRRHTIERCGALGELCDDVDVRALDLLDEMVGKEREMAGK